MRTRTVIAERTGRHQLAVRLRGSPAGSTARHRCPARPRSAKLITLGAILLILGLVLDVGILWTIGIVLLVVGAILFLLGAAGRAVGGRRHYF